MKEGSHYSNINYSPAFLPKIRILVEFLKNESYLTFRKKKKALIAEKRF